MRRADILRNKADHARAEFLQSANNMSDQMRPARLINGLIGAVDPDFNVLKRFQKRMQQSPIIVLAVVASILLLARQRRDPSKRKSTMRQATRNPRLTSAVQKGDKHGYHINAKQQ